MMRGPDIGSRKSAVLPLGVTELPDVDHEDFAAAFDGFGDARVVLLGEASHGTRDFYRARSSITKRLIEREGFTALAIEADWVDAASMDRFVRRREGLGPAEPTGARFPAWMWRNEEMDAFLGWLRQWNDGRPSAEQVSIHGMDVRTPEPAMRGATDFLRPGQEPACESTELFRESLRLFLARAIRPDAQREAFAAGCAAYLQEHRRRAAIGGVEARFGRGDCLDAAIAVHVASNAAAFEQAVDKGFAERWNIRDTHMYEVVRLLARENAKVVVWAHNSHIGDLRHNSFGWSGGLHSLGQLVREWIGPAALLVGMGTHKGTVAAADAPDSPMQIKEVPASRRGSWERLSHDVGQQQFLLDLRDWRPHALRARLHRMIGTVYHPEAEMAESYSASVLAHQYDLWLWLDETKALRPQDSARSGAIEQRVAPVARRA